MMHAIIYLRDLLFPPKCAACHTLLAWHSPTGEPAPSLCSNCLAEWESEELETCGICALRVSECECMPERMRKAKCMSFRKLVYYVPSKRTLVQNRLIYLIKRKNHDRAYAFLASRLSQMAEDVIKKENLAREDVIVTYLPRTRRAHLQNGIDQAAELARRVAENCSFQMKPLLCRSRGGEEQKKLTPVERIRNARGSIDLRKDADPRDKAVLLIDDIVTTGNGMARCTKLLRRAGCRAVYALAVASDVYNKDLH
ncbi:MAG: ComF family protein [Ruminococcaceae bacterium]|nr:ComF family protein [Oscillospiraceae bacterium]